MRIASLPEIPETEPSRNPQYRMILRRMTDGHVRGPGELVVSDLGALAGIGIVMIYLHLIDVGLGLCSDDPLDPDLQGRETRRPPVGLRISTRWKLSCWVFLCADHQQTLSPAADQKRLLCPRPNAASQPTRHSGMLTLHLFCVLLFTNKQQSPMVT